MPCAMTCIMRLPTSILSASRICLLLLLLIATPPCRGAAESPIPLFDIIVGCATKRTRAETMEPKNAMALEKIRELICEYVENKKPITAAMLLILDAAGNKQKISCIKEGIVQTMAQHDITPANIMLIMGGDYHERLYPLVNGASPYATLVYEDPLAQAGIERALDPSHPGVWFAPGEIGTFLALKCTSFDSKKANKEAVMKYKKLSKEDKDLTLQQFCKPKVSLTQKFARWAGLAKSHPQDTGDGGTPEPKASVLYDPHINSPLPPALLNIVFSLLRKTATKIFTWVVTEEGDITAVTITRPLLATESIACILGQTIHRHKHGIFSDPSGWQSFLPDHGKTKLDHALMSHRQVDADELAIIAGTSRGTFLVPSLAELLVKGQLTQKFYDKNKKLVETDFEDKEVKEERESDQMPTSAKNKRRESCRQQ